MHFFYTVTSAVLFGWAAIANRRGFVNFCGRSSCRLSGDHFRLLGLYNVWKNLVCPKKMFFKVWQHFYRNLLFWASTVFRWFLRTVAKDLKKNCSIYLFKCFKSVKKLMVAVWLLKMHFPKKYNFWAQVYPCTIIWCFWGA